jgi:aspartate carbamoyltransferase catalytic subunit
VLYLLLGGAPGEAPAATPAPTTARTEENDR